MAWIVSTGSEHVGIFPLGPCARCGSDASYTRFRSSPLGPDTVAVRVDHLCAECFATEDTAKEEVH